MEETHAVVVVGAGIGGLIAAHRYLCIHPTASLLIVDRNKHIGGVYSKDRIYPGFHTQFVTGLTAFSDLKMHDPPKEDCVGDCFKARWLGKYLEEFAEKMVHDRKSVRSRIRLGVEIMEVTDAWKKGEARNEARWSLRYRDLPPSENANILDNDGNLNIKMGKACVKIHKARNLIIAAGEYCTPNIPCFKHQSTFDAAIVHSTNFGASNLLSTPNIEHITILGAGKSSADMLYTCLKSLPPTTSVHWIIRSDGTGPGFFASLDIPGPYKNGVAAAQTRAMSLLQPSAFHKEGWWVWFLHRTWIGIWLVTSIFGLVDKDSKTRAGYTTRPEAEKRGFKKLEYNPGIFWQNSPGGALHHPDFWDLIASRVTVHRAHITSMSHHTLHLSDDTQIACDALLLGTGFKSSLTFLPQDLKAELGVGHEPKFESTETTKKWAALEAEADEQVTQRFPILSNPPEHHLKRANTTPYRLYWGIAPLNDPTRNIVFVNHLVSGNMIMNAEAQAHWAVAYLTRKVDLPPLEQMEKEVAMQIAYCKRRSLSNGQLGNFFAFDMIVYMDRLMEQLGVDQVWKRKGAFGVNRPEGLGDAWEEWMKRWK